MDLQDTEGAQMNETPDARAMKVLVMDNEPLFADSLVEILKKFGYQAAAAYSGIEAIELARTLKFDFLVTDVVMSGQAHSGIDTAIEVRKILPQCKVLLVSGNERTTGLLGDARQRGFEFDTLAKPVHPTLILEKLKSFEMA